METGTLIKSGDYVLYVDLINDDEPRYIVGEVESANVRVIIKRTDGTYRSRRFEDVTKILAWYQNIGQGVKQCRRLLRDFRERFH